MPLITRIAGIRVELEREVKSFANIEEPFVTWIEHENRELFGLGLADEVSLDEDARAMSALMMWSLQDKVVEWVQERTDPFSAEQAAAKLGLENSSASYAKVLDISNLLGTIVPDWRER